jgi:peptidyl-prolyl cis-trans isomerase C
MFKQTIAITSLLLLTANGYGAKDPVVATVGSIKITKSQLDESYKQNLVFISGKKVSKEKVLNDLINRELGISRAKKGNLGKNPIVRKKMEDILYHAQVSKDLEPKLKKIVVTDKEVDSYYTNHPEYRTAHILFRVRAEPSEEETTAALGQSMKVYKTLQVKPNKFAELANKFSQSSTAPNGGDMGYVPAVRLAPQFYEAIKGKEVNHITSPVRTQFGYHIIKILAKKNVKDINAALYKKIVYDIKRDKILAKYFKDLRKTSTVKVNKQFLK